jgi:hypothetical protein
MPLIEVVEPVVRRCTLLESPVMDAGVLLARLIGQAAVRGTIGTPPLRGTPGELDIAASSGLPGSGGDTKPQPPPPRTVQTIQVGVLADTA